MKEVDIKRRGRANWRLRRPIALDLFSGPGGVTQGLKKAGVRVIGAVELDDLAVETYRANHPEVKVWPVDIRKLHPRRVAIDLNLKPGQLDLLVACPPCEGFSSIRTLNGGRQISDERNDLIFEVLKFVHKLVPKVVIIENVPALARDVRMRLVRSLLGKHGYHHQALLIVDAANYGVAQRRRRMVLVASRVGSPNLNALLKVEKPLTVEDVIGKLPTPGHSGDVLHDIAAVEHRSERIQRMIEQIPENGGSRSALPLEMMLSCHKKTTGFKDVYGRMAWRQPAPTLTSGCVNPSKGRFLHPEQNRAISLREAALLQGFPHRYVFSLRKGKFAAASMIGNAVPPPLMTSHFNAIRNLVLRV